MITGEFATDTAALREHTERGEDLLAALPAKAQRSKTQQAAVEHAHHGSRRLRARFMTVHAERVYAELTDGYANRPRIAELATSAGGRFPGLVPDRAQLATEFALSQEHKEGREIDQAILFAQFLRQPTVGAHLIESMLRPTPRALALSADFHRLGELDLGSVRIERRAGIAHLTICNVHCLNAEDNALTEDLETAVDLALLDDGVRVGVLRGATMTHPRYAGRRVFSAGINLKHLRQGKISYVDFLLRRELGFIHKLWRGLAVEDTSRIWPQQTLEKPWVAAVDTFAIGGGAQLLAVCDRVVAGSDAYFSVPAAREGIVPGAANLRLGRSTGGRLARRVLLGDRRIHADEPDARLVFDDIVDPGEVGDAAERAATQLDSPAVTANRHMLNLAEEPIDRFRVYMGEFALTQAIRLYSTDVLAKVAGAWSGNADGTGGDPR
ncbi:enoyl-CoA hydratase/isomerase family protein [Streptomyces sp. SID3343]|nr:enoyl-CoA hydratase/isomerase family protein [Streptomyces sp. SID3343]